MIARHFLAALLVFMTLAGYSQGKRVAIIELPAPPTFFSVDRPGDLYVVVPHQVLKFDKNGNRLGHTLLPTPTLFEPGDGTLSFAYHRAERLLEFFSPDLTSSDSRPLHPEFAVSPWLVCPSKNELWILDSADVSLKKTKEKGSSIAYEVTWVDRAPQSIPRIAFMREYQNFLFILEKGKGIHIVNNLGKRIRGIDEKDLTYFNFLGEEIYFMVGQSLRLVDLFSTESREIPLPYRADFALLTDDRLILVKGIQVEFFEYRP